MKLKSKTCSDNFADYKFVATTKPEWGPESFDSPVSPNALVLDVHSFDGAAIKSCLLGEFTYPLLTTEDQKVVNGGISNYYRAIELMLEHHSISKCYSPNYKDDANKSFDVMTKHLASLYATDKFKSIPTTIERTKYAYGHVAKKGFVVPSELKDGFMSADYLFNKFCTTLRLVFEPDNYLPIGGYYPFQLFHKGFNWAPDRYVSSRINYRIPRDVDKSLKDKKHIKTLVKLMTHLADTDLFMRELSSIGKISEGLPIKELASYFVPFSNKNGLIPNL